MKYFVSGILYLLFALSLYSNNFKIGILPYTDPLKIISQHQPLKQYIASKLQTNVEIYTSNTYEKFFEDTQLGEFDMVITGPHFGALHIGQGFIPLATYDTTLKPVFVVLKNSPYKKAEDFKNKKIALSNYLSVSSMGGIKTLLESGLKKEVDFKLVNCNSHTSAIMSVVVGDVDGAITTHTPLKQLNDENIKNQIRTFEADIAMPHLFTLANSKLNPKQIAKLKELLYKFEVTQEGKNFFTTTGYKGYKEITQGDINSLKTLLPETKHYLGIK